MDRFCESSRRDVVVKYICEKASLQIFNRVLNTPLVVVIVNRKNDFGISQIFTCWSGAGKTGETQNFLEKHLSMSFFPRHLLVALYIFLQYC